MPVLRYWDPTSSSYIILSGMGPQGAQGVQGAQGFQGAGFQGAQGAQGGPGNTYAIVASTAPPASSPPVPALPEGLLWINTGSGLVNTPGGPASGDLAGNYPSPTVAKINGTAVLYSGTPGQGAFLSVDSAGTWGNMGLGGDLFTTTVGAAGGVQTVLVNSIRGVVTPNPWDTGWQTPTLQNGWLNGSVPNGVYYRRVGWTVYLRGQVYNGTNSSTVFTLPSGCCPATGMCINTIATSSFGGAAAGTAQLTLETNGVVVATMNGGLTTGTGVGFDGISFVTG
jgi:hypothetical protein